MHASRNNRREIICLIFSRFFFLLRESASRFKFTPRNEKKIDIKFFSIDVNVVGCCWLTEDNIDEVGLALHSKSVLVLTIWLSHIGSVLCFATLREFLDL